MKHLYPYHFISGLVLCAGLYLLAGCSPKVYTTVSKSYPAFAHGGEVLVFGLQDTLPADVETLGHVTITDTGFSTGCSYDAVIALAKGQTTQIGGNGLQVTNHEKPSFVSSCHQIEGDMLYIPSSSFLFFRPDSTQQITNAGTAAIAPEPESKSKKSKNTIYANAGYGFITSKFILAP